MSWICSLENDTGDGDEIGRRRCLQCIYSGHGTYFYCANANRFHAGLPLVRHTRIVSPSDKLSNCVARYIPFYAGVEEQCIDLVLTVPQKCKLMGRKAGLIPSYANTGQTIHCRFGPCG
jgi:hypothetical protein